MSRSSPSMEFRKPEVMSKERAMAVLGLGVKKVKNAIFKRWTKHSKLLVDGMDWMGSSGLLDVESSAHN